MFSKGLFEIFSIRFIHKAVKWQVANILLISLCFTFAFWGLSSFFLFIGAWDPKPFSQCFINSGHLSPLVALLFTSLPMLTHKYYLVLHIPKMATSCSAQSNPPLAILPFWPIYKSLDLLLWHCTCQMFGIFSLLVCHRMHQITASKLQLFQHW